MISIKVKPRAIFFGKCLSFMFNSLLLKGFAIYAPSQPPPPQEGGAVPHFEKGGLGGI
jgi:hypothetical protein